MVDEAFEHTNNLENLLSPFCYEPETKLPKTIPEVPGGIYLSGFISQDCTWGCCFNQSVIKCFPVEKYFEDNQNSLNHHHCNSSIAVSSGSYNFTGGRITCATELAIHNQRVSSGTRKLLLGISYSATENNNRDLRGALVIFDPIRCAPMKWIEIPEPVSSVTVLSHFEEGGSNRPFFNETMMAMVGIAAVGLRGGSVVIVDLGLDDPFLSSGQTLDLRSISSLTYRLLYVNPHEYVIATKRHKAVSKRSLISLKFSNEPEIEMISDAFHFCKPTGESILVLHKNAVAVTSIEYIPAIGSLLVGFTFGAFQIWRVNNMELQFSSDPVNLERNVPVVGFCFQQPVDDPKNYCYIWVMYGKNTIECSNSHVELYSLLYENKNHIDNFGYTYDDFKQCAKRMSFALEDDFLFSSSDADADNSLRGSARPIRIWSQPDSDLMFCAWEVGRGGVFYMGAFDLNQWYSNHTREYIHYQPNSGLCPYWVALPIEVPEDSIMLDVRIIPKSLMRWENPHAKLDVHLYPASYSFRAACLTNTGLFAFEHYGVQEKLIRIMLKDGPTLMIQPLGLKKSFLRYGLEPVYPHVYGEHLTQKDRDRFFIFSVMLECRRTAAIIRLANAWLDGSYAKVGCTIDLICDWIGSYMVAVRSVADEHWDNLFIFEDDALPPETIRFINFSNFAWTSLHRMLPTLMNPQEVYSARGVELEDIEFGLGKLVQYSAALLMMYKAKLLPEGDKSFFKGLTEFYEQRRTECRRMIESCSYIDAKYKKSHPLMVDYLMDDLMAQEDIREEWHVDEGQPLYPPQHVGYLVNMFMWPDADPKAISRVFMYFLIDLNYFFAQYASSSSCDVERKIRGDFKAVMDSAGDEYQEVLALWLLDHGYHDEILVHLKERDRLFESDGLPWCAATVALTAAGFESDVAELLIRSCPHSLARLLFSLMTASVSRYNSLADLMVSSNLSSDDALLQEFFEISESRERLGEFVRTKAKELPEGVRNALLIFLNSSHSLKRLSQLLMYYVHMKDYRKLEEELNRVRVILDQRNLGELERKAWKFQENYMMHLLRTKKSDIVENFLRIQSPQIVRQSKSTITIRATAAQIDSSPSSKSPVMSKFPPQLRRLKLNETVTQDPLSPLRRFAGRIQTAITSAEGEMDELRSRRLSRKSISRRFSFSTTRQSMGLGNKTILNQSVVHDEGLNMSLKNTSFDLISLLKTPAVDHRASRRQSSSHGFSITLNQTISGPGNLPEASFSQQPQPVHSIMKSDTDPSKPKVQKKVELNIERLSLNSSEEDDEKNVSVFEDANDEVEAGDNVESAEGEAESPESVPFDSSFSSAVDMEKSIFGSESVVDTSFQQRLDVLDQEVQEGTSSHDEDIVKESIYEKAEESPEKQKICDESDNQEMENTVYGLPVIEEMDEAEEGKDTSLVSVSPSDQSMSMFSATNMVRESGDEQEEQRQDVFVPPEPPSKSTTPSPLPSPNKKRRTSGSQSDKLEKSPLASPAKTPEKEGEANEDEEPVGRRTRSSLSKTPTKETSSLESPTEVGPSTPDSEQRMVGSGSTTPTGESEEMQTRKRVSRSRTPSRDLENVSDEPETGSLRRITRQSKTPTRETTTEKEERSRASRSRTPTRDKAEGGEDDDGENMQTRRRVSRSRTPSRDLENVIEEPETVSLRRITRQSKTPTRETATEKEEKSRASRSRTPTREKNEGEDADGDNTQSRRRVSRSRTPSRDLENVIEEPVAMSLRSLSRRSKTPTRETKVETEERSRASRSRTPTRDKPETEEVDVEEIIKPSRKRVSRSRTPSRDLENVIEEPVTMSLRSLSRKSKTPTRETTTEKEEGPRRVSRSRTPTRDKSEGGEDDDGDNMQTRRRVSRSRTPSRDLENVTEEVETRSLRRSSRRSKTPTREVAFVMEEEIDEPAEDLDSTLTRTTRSRGKKSDPSEESPQKSLSTFSFEKTTMEEEVEDDVDVPEVKAGPSRSRKAKPAAPASRGKKRRLKYFQHEQELSTLIEDSNNEMTMTSDPSVLEATVLPPKQEVPPQKERKIKGIRVRPSEEEEMKVEEEPPVMPRKRSRTSSKVFLDLEDEAADEDDDNQSIVSTQSHMSTRSNRSVASKRSTTAAKAKKGKRGRGKPTEDSSNEMMTSSDVSVLDATKIPSEKEVSPKKKERKTTASTSEEVEEPVKPRKRSRTAKVLDLDNEEGAAEEEDDDNQSHVSTRSNRSVASKRSTTSAKTRKGRRGKGK